MTDYLPNLPTQLQTVDVGAQVVLRTAEWLAAHVATLPSAPAVCGYALALSTLCVLLDGSAHVRDVHGSLLAQSDSADLSYVDPITAVFLKGITEKDGSNSEKPLPCLLTGTVADARQAIALIEMETCYGTRTRGFPEPCGEIVQGMALAAARNRDLIYALRCARASTYICETTPSFRGSIVDLILFGQGVDGSFVHEAALAPQSRSSPALAFVLRCAVSVQALWTLQEFTRPGERVIGRLRAE